MNRYHFQPRFSQLSLTDTLQSLTDTLWLATYLNEGEVRYLTMLSLAEVVQRR